MIVSELVGLSDSVLQSQLQTSGECGSYHESDVSRISLFASLKDSISESFFCSLTQIAKTAPVLSLTVELKDAAGIQNISKETLQRWYACGVSSLDILMDFSACDLMLPDPQQFKRFAEHVSSIFARGCGLSIYHQECQSIDLEFFSNSLQWAKVASIFQLSFLCWDLDISEAFVQQLIKEIRETKKIPLRLSRIDFCGHKSLAHLELENLAVRLERWKRYLPVCERETYGTIEMLHSIHHEQQATTINIIPTDVCNARCPYCITYGLGFMYGRIRRNTLYEYLPKGLDYVKRRGGTIANISGGGEPTLSPEIANIVSCAALYFSEIVLHTNGSLLLRRGTKSRKTLFEELAARGLTGISLHRIAVDDNANFEGMKLNENSRYSMIELMSLAKSLNVHVQLSCPLLKEYVGNEDELNAFLEWAALMGVDRIAFRELLDQIPVRSSSNHETIDYCEDNRVQKSLVEKLQINYPDQFRFLNKAPWGEAGMDWRFEYVNSSGKSLTARILEGKWHDVPQTRSQTSGFVFRSAGDKWALYSGWMTVTDRVF